MSALKHIELLRTSKHPSLYLMVSMLAEDHKDKLIQRAINATTGESTVGVDGMIGPRTVGAIMGLDPGRFADEVIKLERQTKSVAHTITHPTGGSKHDHNAKERIMKYLASAEGLLIHWNSTESNMTTPYGIYRKSFPHSKIFVYIDQLSRKYVGHPIRRRNLRELAKLNASLTRLERTRIRDMAWAFYQANFMDKRVLKRLDTQPKAALTFFSNSVNGGRSRGVKSLQSALKMRLTGRVKDPMLKRLDAAVRRGQDLNKGMLRYMLGFYNSLVRKNRKKYGRYLRGWKRRLRNLA